MKTIKKSIFVALAMVTSITLTTACDDANE